MKIRELAAEEQGLPWQDSDDYEKMPMTPQQHELATELTQLINAEIESFKVFLHWYQRALHLVVLLLGVLGIVYRQSLGSILVVPLQGLFGLGKASAKAAKDLHKKV